MVQMASLSSPMVERRTNAQQRTVPDTPAPQVRRSPLAGWAARGCSLLRASAQIIPSGAATDCFLARAGEAARARSTQRRAGGPPAQKALLAWAPCALCARARHQDGHIRPGLCLRLMTLLRKHKSAVLQLVSATQQQLCRGAQASHAPEAVACLQAAGERTAQSRRQQPRLRAAAATAAPVALRQAAPSSPIARRSRHAKSGRPLQLLPCSRTSCHSDAWPTALVFQHFSGKHAAYLCTENLLISIRLSERMLPQCPCL